MLYELKSFLENNDTGLRLKLGNILPIMEDFHGKNILTGNNNLDIILIRGDIQWLN